MALGQGKKAAPMVPNKTPAPTRTSADLALAKDTAWGRAAGGIQGNPGQNAYGGPSSLSPGEKPMDSIVQGTNPDPVRDEIISRGTARNLNVGDSTGRTLAQNGGDGLLRDLAASGTGHGTKGKPSPVHAAMAPRGAADGSPGGAVPSGVDTGATANPVRKPS
jgi:hypothetical protein